MDIYHVKPLPRGKDYGTVEIPGSKSITNRALCLSAFAKGQSELRGMLMSDDSLHCLNAVAALGAKVAVEKEAGLVRVTGIGRNYPSKAKLDVGSAGTAARFLTAMVSFLPGEFMLQASVQMQLRPMADLFSVLASQGVDFQYLGSPFYLPCIKREGRLRDHQFTVNCEKSSQFLSGLLLASALSEHDVTITVASKLVAQSYVDMTIAVLAQFGIAVVNDAYRVFTIKGGQEIQATRLDIEPDVSSASYFFSIPAVVGGSIRVKNITKASLQGDIQFLDLLADLGCTVQESSQGITIANPGGRISGISVDMNDFSDQVITMAVLGVDASAAVHIQNIAHIQYQESNRIAACISQLRKLGILVEEKADGFVVHPGSIRAAEIETFDDHRMAMGFTLLGLAHSGISILDPLCCRKTFPTFFQLLEGLY